MAISAYMVKSPIFPNIVFNSFLSFFYILINSVWRVACREPIGEIEYNYEFIYAVMRSGGYTYVYVI